MYWNGTDIGNISNCNIIYNWGTSKRIVNIPLMDNILVVRTLDRSKLACIADELSGLFGLYKTGTISMSCKSYRYTCYSFMCGEKPYIIGTDYELDEMVFRWKMYYSWWNIQLDDKDFYIRRYMSKDIIVVYPSCAWRSSDIIDKDSFKIILPNQSKTNMSNQDILDAWLGCYSDNDRIKFIDKARTSLLGIIDRINPECIHITSIILSRIKTFLFYDMEEK